jgi:hypothetical protein
MRNLFFNYLYFHVFILFHFDFYVNNHKYLTQKSSPQPKKQIDFPLKPKIIIML